MKRYYNNEDDNRDEEEYVSKYHSEEEEDDDEDYSDDEAFLLQYASKVGYDIGDYPTSLMMGNDIDLKSIEFKLYIDLIEKATNIAKESFFWRFKSTKRRLKDIDEIYIDLVNRLQRFSVGYEED